MSAVVAAGIIMIGVLDVRFEGFLPESWREVDAGELAKRIARDGLATSGPFFDAAPSCKIEA